MDKHQLHILRHALGLNQTGNEYRNHFVTGPGSKDYNHCMALVKNGHMTRRSGSCLTGGNDLFLVTDPGRAAALQEQPGKQR